MDGEDLADLAREYGLDPRDYGLNHNQYDDGYDDTCVAAYPDYGNYAEYDEIEDYTEDRELWSSPCPPARPSHFLRAGVSHRPGQHAPAGSSSARFDTGSGVERPQYHGYVAPQKIVKHTPHIYAQHWASGDSLGDTENRVHHQPQPKAAYGRTNMTSGDTSPPTQPRNAHGIRLHPTSDLPDMYRGLFKFGVFNAVQSTCFDKVMNGDANMVISAPTGSGKTVLFELAIIRMLQQAKSRGRESKCIYVAPTKALCSEKHRDWVAKFQPLGVNCCELTGDTVQFGKSAWGDARNASIIVTTGEKWDSLTRNWEEHDQILSQIQLFLVDEVHILNESRGSTLEVIVSRMKTRGSLVRFVLVSATVPNIKDVANWIGNGPYGGPAVVMEFGEEYRPCKLTKHVYGVVRKKEQNDFMFTRNLDFKLYGILKQHSVNKPVLVFCATRKGVVATAEQLMKEYEQDTKQKETLPWARPRRIDTTFHDKRLDKLAICGIGVHHAGMTLDDRRATETLYLDKLLRVVVATSTLAVGVNLPAHTVVIKGVKIFQNNASQEYSDLDIMQMMGRAGRPQFDKEGIAIIMCEMELKQKYEALVQGRTVLESCLHANLSEHINSEIGLGTIKSVDSAKNWLHNSFLFQRIQQNPGHYAIGKAGNQTWQERIDEMVMESVQKLQVNELVTSSETELASTEYGEIMSKYYIRQSTMSAMLKLSDRASLRDMLEMLSTAEEFADIKIRSGEKQIYNKLCTNDDIRFKLKKVEKAPDKISLIIQAILGGINLNDPEFKNGDNQPSLEALTIFRHVERITRAMVEVAIVKQSGAQVKHGMELMRCLSAKAWEDRPIVLRQVEHIGEKSIKVLTQHGITSLADVRKQDPLRIETLLNRRPPFGHEVLAFVKQLPQYSLHVTEVGVTPSDGTSAVEVELSIDCGLVCDLTDASKPRRGKSKFKDCTLVVIVNSDLDYIDFRRISTKALQTTKTFSVTAKLMKPSQSVIVEITSERTAGIAVTKMYRPNIPRSDYPTLVTRPPTSLELDMEGLAEDPAFWHEMQEGPSDDEVIPVKDLTDPRSNARSAPQIRSAAAGSEDREDCVNQNTSQPRYQARTSTTPQRLPNGNYACNHTCKDKAACRHLCCREGLPKPPPLTKKRVETLYPTERTATQKPVAKPKHSQEKQKQTKEKPLNKPDPRIAELEKLHERNSVKVNLQLPEGRRIKLDDGKSISNLSGNKTAAKPKATFEMDFVDLRSQEMPGLRAADLSEVSDGDDFPDARGILDKRANARKEKESSESAYANPELDDLIANMSSPLVAALSPPARNVSAAKEAVYSTDTLTSVDFEYKRRRDDGGSTERGAQVSPIPPPKRARIGKSNEPVQRLFLFDSDEEDQLADDVADDIAEVLPPGPHEDEEFVIDDNLFAFQRTPSERSPTNPPLDLWIGEDDGAAIKDFKASTQSKITSKSPAKPTVRDIDVPTIEAIREPADALDDALAEFEEWLQSGSVIIVDRMD